MKSIVRSILLWLFVINLGIAVGAGLYEARVVIPAWASLPPSEWPNTGLMFWVYVTTIPLTLLTIANAVAAWTDKGRVRRKWWLAAVAVAVLERIVTFAYFIPTMIGLQSGEMPAAEVAAGLTQWLQFNMGRHVLSVAGWLLALKAFSISENPPEANKS